MRIMFICHGNICRSPMAEFIFKDLVRKAGLESDFHIESSATSCEEIGNDIYPPAQAVLRQHGIPFNHRSARRITPGEYKSWDLLICMDRNNLRNLERIMPDPDQKVHLLLDYTGESRDVADPWYSGDFEKTWDDILSGCQALLAAYPMQKKAERQ